MPDQLQWQKIFRYASIGGELVVIFSLLMIGGLALDRKLQTTPLFTLIGAFAGFGLGIYRMVKDLRQEQRHEKDHQPPDDRKSDT